MHKVWVVGGVDLAGGLYDVYAAGDVAFFPDQVLGPRRIEHWDNAITQGKHAGRNMAGANEPFRDMPYFFPIFSSLVMKRSAM
jgi:NADPH-dependent 2,4-dienoyl-CoA reductase/sulfur reductase-like enzyme